MTTALAVPAYIALILVAWIGVCGLAFVAYLVTDATFTKWLHYKEMFWPFMAFMRERNKRESERRIIS